MADKLLNIGRMKLDSFVPEMNHSYIGSPLGKRIKTQTIITGGKRKVGNPEIEDLALIEFDSRSNAFH